MFHFTVFVCYMLYAQELPKGGLVERLLDCRTVLAESADASASRPRNHLPHRREVRPAMLVLNAAMRGSEEVESAKVLLNIQCNNPYFLYIF